jgi:hypothetical protein
MSGLAGSHHREPKLAKMPAIFVLTCHKHSSRHCHNLGCHLFGSKIDDVLTYVERIALGRTSKEVFDLGPILRCRFKQGSIGRLLIPGLVPGIGVDQPINFGSN